MTFLLDVNVLIALIDPDHVSHEAAHFWFAASGSDSWATCPITENGVIRIVGSNRYPNSPGTPSTVATILSGMCALPGHEFWPDDLRLIASKFVDPTRVLTAAQITDTYLLALARSRSQKLATLDRRLSTAAVPGGKETLHLIAG